ncbi:glutamine amidotransferase [uncultured Cedecea sp.]|uniref:glutamine amidotransferase n=1 Tax=uncultured Cedecea sp. TaxID=988762 RepID=UPI00263386FB|nr:glutamine amidotransferase [uncultured Cedecea sp.]
MNNIFSQKTSSARVGFPPILLIQTGTPPDALREQHGDLPVWFHQAMGVKKEDIQVVKVYRGEALPEPDPRRIAVITGSWDMVTDKLPWSEYTAAWIRHAFAANMPLFGVCYGHQLMAYALGGTVDYHPQGREMGCLNISLTQAGIEDSLTGAFPQKFSANLTHLQTVTTLPPGAKVLASSRHDAHQIVRYSDKAVSTQFHPEVTPKIIATMIDLRSEALLNEGYHPDEMQKALRDAPEAREILKVFVLAHMPPESETIHSL